jgi:tRNA (guanine37-N1)-methyltransferase
MVLRQHLIGIIPGNMLSLLSNGYEVIGDVAVFTIPESLTPYQGDIAAAITMDRKRIRTVLRKISKREGDRRIASYEPVIGASTRTVHRESGFEYQVDLAASFFTTRLAGERQRITSLIQPGETVLVPFAGVGPFAIPAAARGARVIAIEMNPFACDLLKGNAIRNLVDDRIIIIRSDALTIDSMLSCQVDRAVIPTPYGLDDALFPVSRVVKPGGWIHFYTFKNRKQAEDLRFRFMNTGYSISRVHRCGNVAPSVSRWVYDMKTGCDKEAAR